MTTIFAKAEADEAFRTDLTEPTLAHADVAATWGVGETSVRRYRKKYGIAVQKPLPGLPEPDQDSAYDIEDVDSDISLAEQNSLLRAANTRLFKQAAKHKQKSEAMIGAVYQAAYDAASSVDRAKQVRGPSKDSRKKSEEGCLWHTTDWQGGKETSSFNLAVLEQRLETYVDKAMELTEIMRADHPVRHGIVLMTGDMLEGCGIFPGQEHEIEATLFEQIFEIARLAEWMIKQALATYETIDVICEWGNHGRIGKKGDGFKPSDNFDRIIYEIVRGRFEHEPRIKAFQVDGTWYQHFTYGNYRALAIHGDEIKSFGGNIPAYGILKKANAWATGVVPSFRDLYIGHYHQSMQLQMANGGSVYMTGSPESDNEYAREFVAATGDPSQRINFISPKQGFVTYESRIWL